MCGRGAPAHPDPRASQDTATIHPATHTPATDQLVAEVITGATWDGTNPVCV